MSLCQKSDKTEEVGTWITKMKSVMGIEWQSEHAHTEKTEKVFVHSREQSFNTHETSSIDTNCIHSNTQLEKILYKRLFLQQQAH